MNKLKFLAATTLCSLFLIGLAGCGGNPEGESCTQATADNDCASSTATKYACHSDNKCHVDCTSDAGFCSSSEKCMESTGGKKVCVAKNPTGNDPNNGDCGGKTCQQGEVCDKTDPKKPVCKPQAPAGNTYWSILIVDKSTGKACDEKDAGADIAGVLIKSKEGTLISTYGSSSFEPGSNIQSPYTSNSHLPEDPLTPDASNCAIKGLSDNSDKSLVLGCGGQAVFQNQTKKASFTVGDKIEVFEYDGNVCYKKTAPSPKSPDDTYAVYACKSSDASVDPKTNITIGTDCILQAEDLHGYQVITVK